MARPVAQLMKRRCVVVIGAGELGLVWQLNVVSRWPVIRPIATVPNISPGGLQDRLCTLQGIPRLDWFLIKRQAVDLFCVEDVRHEHFRPLQAHANLDRIALTVQHWLVVLVALGLFFFKLPILDGCAFFALAYLGAGCFGLVERQPALIVAALRKQMNGVDTLVPFAGSRVEGHHAAAVSGLPGHLPRGRALL